MRLAPGRQAFRSRAADVSRAPRGTERKFDDVTAAWYVLGVTPAPVPMPVTDRFADAVRYALAVHGADRRKGTSIPYVAHLLGVASLVLEHGGDEDQAIAALLHDTAEDHGGEARLAHVAAAFGDGVRMIVEACSDSLEEDPAVKAEWWSRKVAYVCHLASAPPRALLVSASDKLHNLRSIATDHRAYGELLWNRFTGGSEGTLWYYRSLARVFPTCEVPPSLSSEFASSVESLFAEVKEAEKLWSTACARAAAARGVLGLPAVVEGW